MGWPLEMRVDLIRSWGEMWGMLNLGKGSDWWWLIGRGLGGKGWLLGRREVGKWLIGIWSLRWYMSTASNHLLHDGREHGEHSLLSSVLPLSHLLLHFHLYFPHLLLPLNSVLHPLQHLSQWLQQPSSSATFLLLPIHRKMEETVNTIITVLLITLTQLPRLRAVIASLCLVLVVGRLTAVVIEF